MNPPLAKDGFTSTEVLNGGKEGRVLSTERQGFCNPGNLFHPLKHLEIYKNRVSHVVLSFGGNDIREILSNPSKIGSAVKKLQKNYSTILKTIKKIDKNIKIIIVTQYCPDITKDSCYGVYKALKGENSLHALMQKVYKPILKKAKTLKIPVIDLANTMNYRDTSLYVNQIEPSAKGGQLIAHMISKVVKKHDFNSESNIYYSDSNDKKLPLLEDKRGKWSVIPKRILRKKK